MASRPLSRASTIENQLQGLNLGPDDDLSQHQHKPKVSYKRRSLSRASPDRHTLVCFGHKC